MRAILFSKPDEAMAVDRIWRSIYLIKGKIYIYRFTGLGNGTVDPADTGFLAEFSN